MPTGTPPSPGTPSPRAQVSPSRHCSTVRRETTRSATEVSCGSIPWDASVSEATALDLVDDEETLRLAREVVDTLYNRTTVASIGCASASYSTEITDGRTVRLEDEAQELALDLPENDAAPSNSGHEEPRDQVRSAVSSHESSVFAAVLRDRESEEWQASLRKLRGAATPRQQEGAFKHHANLVAHSLAGAAAVTMDLRLQLKMAIRSGSMAGATTGGLEILGAFHPVVGGILTTGAAAAPGAVSAYTAHREIRATRKALGRMMGPSPR